MNKMGIEALALQPGISQREPRNRIYPYLLRNVAIARFSQGVGAGHHLHSDGARVCISHRRGGRGQPLGAGAQCCDHAGSVPRLGSYHAAFDRYGTPEIVNTPIRANSSLLRSSPRRCWLKAASCRWTGAASGAITYSSSACGAA